jgi:hypothetical protein
MGPCSASAGIATAPSQRPAPTKDAIDFHGSVHTDLVAKKASNLIKVGERHANEGSRQLVGHSKIESQPVPFHWVTPVQFWKMIDPSSGPVLRDRRLSLRLHQASNYGSDPFHRLCVTLTSLLASEKGRLQNVSFETPIL